MKARFTDFEIANSIKLIKEPRTVEGNLLVGFICEAALSHADDSTPTEVIVYKEKFMDREIEVKIFGLEQGKKLLGQAALNSIVVKDKNLIGVTAEEVPHYSTKTDFTYIHGIANLVAYEVEKAIAENRNEVLVEVKNVNDLIDINMRIEDAVKDYIESKDKKIDVKGQVFFHISAKIL